MVVTAWTGVASAPCGSPTLCSLLMIDLTKMAETKAITEEQLSMWRAKFTELACDPEQLLVLTIDEVSFLQPEALHLVDIQLRRLCGRPDIPFGGIALILTGDFWQKPPPSSISLAEMLAGADVQGLPRHKPPESMSTDDEGLAIFREARQIVMTQQIRVAEDP